MDASPVLNHDEAAPTGPGSRTACPRCGTDWSAIPEVRIHTLGSKAIRRCPRCGTRGTTASGGPAWVFSCNICGVPFLHDGLLTQTAQRCEPCRSGTEPIRLPEAGIIAAAEHEILAALSGRWDAVRNAELSKYLERLVRQVGRRMDLTRVRVIVTDDWSLRAIALPSGTVLISLGLLDFLDDEAELAFVLGHELAHAVSGDAAERLTRLGLVGLLQSDETSGSEAWAAAAEDLVRLGFGRRREREADRRALDAILDMGYDPESAFRLLERLQARFSAGDPQVADLATAHPPADDRVSRMRASVYRRLDGNRLRRVNREVFRRAARPEILHGSLVRFRLNQEAGLTFLADAEESRRRSRRIFWTSAGIVVLASVILLVSLLLAR